MKKTFKQGDNPAMAYITPKAQETEHTRYTETKTMRINLIIQPTLHKDMKKLATMQRISINELVTRVLRDYAEANTDTIDRYIKVFGEE